jgi:hypothetical protein
MKQAMKKEIGALGIYIGDGKPYQYIGPTTEDDYLVIGSKLPLEIFLAQFPHAFQSLDSMELICGGYNEETHFKLFEATTYYDLGLEAGHGEPFSTGWAICSDGEKREILEFIKGYLWLSKSPYEEDYQEPDYFKFKDGTQDFVCACKPCLPPTKTTD